MRRLVLIWLAASGCATAVPLATPDLATPHDAAPAAPPDLTVPLDLPPPDLALPRPHAILNAVPDLAGFATALDGSSSTDPFGRALGFAWHVMQAPPHSAVTDAALTPSAAVAKPTFVSDLGGAYIVTLTVTAPDGAADTATASVNVPTAPLFYYQGTLTYDASQIGVGVVRSDGTGAHVINCPFVLANGTASPGGLQSNNPFTLLPEIGKFGLRTWDPPAAQLGVTASRVAFMDTVSIGVDSSATNEYRLWAGDDQSDCHTRSPVRIEDPNGFADHPHLFPRFSPNGRRLAYIDGNHSFNSVQWRLVTIGADGNNRHVVRAVASDAYSQYSAALAPTAPAWVDDTHVAWLENLGSYGTPKLTLYQALDGDAMGDAVAPTGSRTTVIDCWDSGAMKPILTAINQFEFVPGGLLVAGSTETPRFNSDPGTVSLYRMSGACSVAQPLASEPSYGESFDFQLSPDGQRVVMASTHGLVMPDATSATPPRDIFVLNADGTGAITRLAGDPNLDDFGPRWVAGGRLVMWTQQSTDPDSGWPTGGGLMLVNADGTHARSLVPQSGSFMNTTLVLGGTSQGHVGCSWMPGAPGALAFGFVLAAVALVLVRRSRRD